MYLNITTGYTFKQAYGPLKKIAKKCKQLCEDAQIMSPYAGICDYGNTFAHVPWSKVCDEVVIKPIYGVRLPVVEMLKTDTRRYEYNWMTLIAQNQKGLQEIYRLVDLSFQQFYYRQRITYDQINQTNKQDILLLSGIAPKIHLIKREFYYELSPSTPLCNRKLDKLNNRIPMLSQYSGKNVACIDNFYVDGEDDVIYEPFADERLRERKTTPLHILTKKEWLHECKQKEAFELTTLLAQHCNVKLKKAKMVKYNGEDNIEKLCSKAAVKKGIHENKKYISRYKKEIKLIKEKDYVDYFLIVADLVRYAKTVMAVGPARGSSGGSLVCWLLGITEIDPIKYDLYFERFIDINRYDLPDIDIDFQDDKRHLIVKYLEKKYGKNNIAQIANINKLKPRSAINRFADALAIPKDELEEFKNSVIERHAGHERANQCIEDTFNKLESGKTFLENHPQMEVVKYIEGHPSHMGVHAAGMLVCNNPITNYCGINSRNKKRIAMIDKKDAEHINLLKIDALSLETMTILAETCDLLKRPYEDLYKIPLNNKKTYKVFNDHRFNGIFQFEGDAIQKFASQMPIENIEDISALNSICRPGPLQSGGAQRYVNRRSGKSEIEYIVDHPLIVKATKNTYGVVIYQEQIMRICRELGGFSWGETGNIRKAISKSKGSEYLNKTFFDPFRKGCQKNGLNNEEIINVWNQLKTAGGYAFNKSHSIAYSIISYMCAFMKANYPNEFLIANLNHAKSPRSGLKILRDAVENDGVNYIWFDKEKSMENWFVIDGKLYGGFINFDGLGPKKAKEAVNKRDNLPTGIKNKIKDNNNPYRYVYPATELYGDYYTNPRKHRLNNPCVEIKNMKKDGDYVFIGCLIKKTLRDANEAQYVKKRDGKLLDGQTSWINIVIEDDTASVLCKIKIEDYNRFGKNIAENGKEEKDWYMIYGKKLNDYGGMIFVKNIKKITR